MADGILMPVSQDMKHDILKKLTEEMYKYVSDPQDEHFSIVAEALIGKHPCLKRARIHQGFQWTKSLSQTPQMWNRRSVSQQHRENNRFEKDSNQE